MADSEDDREPSPPRPVDPTAPVRIGSTIPMPADFSASSTQPAGEAAPDLVGRILGGRYSLERVIGRGGMGIVYEARHVTVGRRVAVKVLRPDLARNEQAMARFHREAQAAAAIGNEHIVEVFDFGQAEDGAAFLAMEMLDGEDLGALIRHTGPLAEGRAVGIVRQVAVALNAAHEKGIIHRDLKSENVFILARDGQEFVKVVDFGISKVQEIGGERGPITNEGVVMGTPHYMAPEQGTGGVEPDHRIDIYAMGCLLFEMLTGKLPYSGATPLEVVFKHVHEPIPTPSRVAPSLKISATLDAVVRRAMAKDREKRFASATAFLEALPEPRALAGGERAYVTQPPETRRRPPVETRWRQRVLFASLVAAGGLVTELAWRMRTREPAERAVIRPAQATHVDAAVAVDVARVAEADAGVAVAPSPRVLMVLVTPPEARLAIDERDAGVGGLSERFARGSRHTVTATLDGYTARSETVTLDDDRTLRWNLLRVPPRVVPRPAHEAPRVDGGAAAVPGEGLKQSPYGTR